MSERAAQMRSGHEQHISKVEDMWKMQLEEVKATQADAEAKATEAETKLLSKVHRLSFQMRTQCVEMLAHALGRRLKHHVVEGLRLWKRQTEHAQHCSEMELKWRRWRQQHGRRR